MKNELPPIGGLKKGKEDIAEKVALAKRAKEEDIAKKVTVISWKRNQNRLLKTV